MHVINPGLFEGFQTGRVSAHLQTAFVHKNHVRAIWWLFHYMQFLAN